MYHVRPAHPPRLSSRAQGQNRGRRIRPRAGVGARAPPGIGGLGCPVFELLEGPPGAGHNSGSGDRRRTRAREPPERGLAPARVAARRALCRRGRRRALAASAADAGTVRRRGRHDPRSRFPRPPRTNGARDTARLCRAGAGARATRAPRGDRLAIHRRGDRAAARGRSRPDCHLPSGRTGLDSASLARASWTDFVHGDARTAEKRRGAPRCVHALDRSTSGGAAAVAGRRRHRSRRAMAADDRASATGRADQTSRVHRERSPLRFVRASLDARTSVTSRRLRHAGARGDDGRGARDRQQPRRTP